MKLENKRYCMHNLFSLIMEKLIIDFPNKNKEDLIAEFTRSNVYKNLYDEKTRLWAEGPDYILNLYYEELKSFKKNKRSK